MNSGKVLVTGSAGLIGSAVLRELRAHGYQVTPVDRSQQHQEDTRLVDMQDLGQVLGVMHGQDAVVHLAAIPCPQAIIPPKSSSATTSYPPSMCWRPRPC